ncbi:MAG: hypothetical protein IKU11_12230 [Clostridia bacterium]|nr:hypothetical protein [Clostridia bacterium]
MEELLNFIRNELPDADRQTAEGLVMLLHQKGAIFTRDLGYWKSWWISESMKLTI